jgi:hypothetical protein
MQSMSLPYSFGRFNERRQKTSRLTQCEVNDNLIPIRSDINFLLLVIPGVTQPAPYSIRGNPSRLWRDFWIPAPRFREDKLRGNDAPGSY